MNYKYIGNDEDITDDFRSNQDATGQINIQKILSVLNYRSVNSTYVLFIIWSYRDIDLLI